MRRLRVRYWPVIDALDLEEGVDRAGHHDVAAVLPGAGSDVDHVVGHPDGVLVVLDHDHGVAQIAESQQGLDQLVVVPLVQPDRRFVEHVEHPDQAAADLRRQPDALRFASGQGGCRTVEAQVVEADVEQELHPGPDLPEHPVGDEMIPLGQLQAVHRPGGVPQGQVAELEDVAPGDRHRQALGLEPGPPAGRAGHLAHVALDGLPGVIGLGLGVAAGQPRHHAFVVGVVAADPPVAVAVLDVNLAVARPEEHQLLVGLLQVLPRGRHGEGVGRRQRLEHPAEVLAAPAGPGGDGALLDGLLRVADHQLGVDLEPGPQPVAVGAGPVGRVEAEVARGQLVERQPARRTGQMLAEGERVVLQRRLVIPSDQLYLGYPLGQAQRGLQRVGEAPLDPVPLDQAVHHHLDGVDLVPGQLGRVGQLVHLAVDARPGEALSGQLLEQALVLALAAADDRAPAPGSGCRPAAPGCGRRSAGASGAGPRSRPAGSAARPPGRRAAGDSRRSR